MLEIQTPGKLIVLAQSATNERAWSVTQAEGNHATQRAMGLTFYKGDPPHWWGIPALSKIQEVLNAHNA